MKTSEELDAEAAQRQHASNTNRLAFVEDLTRPAKTAVRARVHACMHAYYV